MSKKLKRVTKLFKGMDIYYRGIDKAVGITSNPATEYFFTGRKCTRVIHNGAEYTL